MLRRFIPALFVIVGLSATADANLLDTWQEVQANLVNGDSRVAAPLIRAAEPQAEFFRFLRHVGRHPGVARPVDRVLDEGEDPAIVGGDHAGRNRPPDVLHPSYRRGLADDPSDHRLLSPASAKPSPDAAVYIAGRDHFPEAD